MSESVTSKTLASVLEYLTRNPLHEPDRPKAVFTSLRGLNASRRLNVLLLEQSLFYIHHAFGSKYRKA